MSIYLVTGAAGHLGSHVVKALIDRDDRVRALLMPGEALPPFLMDCAQIEKVFGDVRDPEALSLLFDGAGGDAVVIHCAGIVEITGRANRRLHEVNVGGTKNVLDACARFGARRLVYVSSVHAIPTLPRGQVMREIEAFDPDSVSGPYDKSKAEATRLVLDRVKDGLDAVCVHPTGIIGPHANPSVGSARLISACLRGRLLAAVRGGFDFVDVRDVAEGILAAADGGRSGACYILSNRFVSFRELLDTLARAAGIRRIRLYLPAKLALMLAPLAEAYYRATRSAPLFTRYALETSTRNALYSHEKATRELGYKTRSLARTMIDIVAASSFARKKRAPKSD
jgi:dihydroflavonol-4-reductase